ncbi:endochitinase [Caerostris extrusa]|uniref:chitinase n=1 Tax=Caerostris extrusa TaxID=172846 RepID=A0AAV4MTV0_CAEEX|nr:endochitinase [Caerostris extrusa]
MKKKGGVKSMVQKMLKQQLNSNCFLIFDKWVQKTNCSSGQASSSEDPSCSRGGRKVEESIPTWWVKSRRDTFVRSAVKWVTDFGFDGFDLDWEYPGASDQICSLSEEYFAQVSRKERENSNKSFKSCQLQNLDSGGYEVPRLAELFDWINVMTYDLRARWLTFMGQHGAPKHKLVVGVPFYGRTYTLGSKENNGLRAGIKKWMDGGLPGPYTNASGFLAYYEICPHVNSGAWTKKYDDIGKCPYAYYDDQWIGYEDEDSIGIKMDYIREQGFGGAMIWAIDMDDFNGVCGRKNALLEVMNEKLRGYAAPTPDPRQTTEGSTLSTSKWWPPRASESTTQQTWWPPASTKSTTVWWSPNTSTTPRPSSGSGSSSGSSERIVVSPYDQPGAPDCKSGPETRPHSERDKYYWCIGDRPVLMQCESGSFYDPRKGKCAWNPFFNRADNTGYGGYHHQFRTYLGK